MVSQSTRKREWCSWCFTKQYHRFCGIKTIGRARHNCAGCGRLAVKCRLCPAMARVSGRIGDQFCAAHGGEIGSFESLGKKIHSLSEYFELISERKVRNVRKIAKVGIGVIGGVTVLTPMSLLAAPAVGAAVSAMGFGTAGGTLYGIAATNAGLAFLGGGTLASGALGVAGGAAVVTATGAAVGGTLGGAVASAYYGNVRDRKFHLFPDRRPSPSSPCVVVVNGFLTQKTVPDWQLWSPALAEHFRQKAWYQLSWESKCLRELGALGIGPGGNLAKSLAHYLKLTAKNPAKLLGRITNIYTGYELARNPWHVAMVKSKMTGVILADAIARLRRPRITFVGHSLGARVIFSALTALATRGIEVIDDVHLLGGAVEARNKEAWQHAARAVRRKIYNYYSKNDKVLRTLYKTGTGFQSEPIGIQPIKGDPKIVNVSVSTLVKSHSDFKTRAAEVLARGLGYRQRQVPGVARPRPTKLRPLKPQHEVTI